MGTSVVSAPHLSGPVPFQKQVFLSISETDELLVASKANYLLPLGVRWKPPQPPFVELIGGALGGPVLGTDLHAGLAPRTATLVAVL